MTADGERAAELPRWCTLVRADNPGPMTLDGTNTYVLRTDADAGSVVVDPGPREAEHLAAVAATGPVALVLLTHGHPDHAEGARDLAERVGAPLAAADPAWCAGAEPLADGQTFAGVAGLDLRVVATPGHTSDSVCLLVATAGAAPTALLTGDTILGRGTSVVAHPDGRLAAYLASLTRIRDLHQAGPLLLLPGHGPARSDAAALSRDYLAHRRQRLEQVRLALAAGDSTAHDVVRRVYADVDERLWPAAELSVQAQLDYLREQDDGRES